MTRGSVVVTQLTRPDHVTNELRDALGRCWTEVSNAGGAVGFPHPPVDPHEVNRAVEQLAAELDPDYLRILVAVDGAAVAGWVVISRNRAPVASHWGAVQRLQTALSHRGQGVGQLLMGELRRVARDEMGLEQLWLAVRSGLGLEDFYAGLGWVVAGRHESALRLAPGDDRDEIFLSLRPL